MYKLDIYVACAIVEWRGGVTERTIIAVSTDPNPFNHNVPTVQVLNIMHSMPHIPALAGVSPISVT